jgi:kynurenine formamidase
MQVLDLTHFITPSMPVYPGTEPPEIRQAVTVERDGFAEKWIGMFSHTGTHIDAPAHMLAGAPTLDRMGVERFCGRACALDVRATDGLVGLAELAPHAERIAASEFVLLCTGWAGRWGSPAYFEDFPVLAADAAQWLAGRGLKGVGFDAISADPVGSADFGNHMALLGAGLILIENLTGLEALLGREFLFSCLPLKLEEADGSPVRAVAILD